ncbi:MAG: S9 family peptidase [Phycisphaerales bacterium]|nr:MAG: S9 family peptidase [Phycisphaerales bacterium]
MNRTLGVGALVLAMVAGALTPTVSWGEAGAPGGRGVEAEVAAGGPDLELLARYLRIRTPGAATVGADGSLYVRDWPNGVFQVYRVAGEKGRSTAGPGSKLIALTDFADGASSYSLSPDGKVMLASAAVGGNENTQVYVVDRDGRVPSVKAILEQDKVVFTPMHWLKDSSGFLYSANDESANDFYLYRYDFVDGDATKAGTRTKLLGKPGYWVAADMSDDGSRVLVMQYFSSSHSVVQELDVASGVLRDLSILPDKVGEKTPTAAQEPIGYMPGERQVLMTSDAEEGLKQVFVRDLATGTLRLAIPALAGRQVDEATMNDDRSLLAVVANVDGYGELSVYRLPGFEVVRLPEMEKGVVSGVKFRGRDLYWSLSNARTPGTTSMATVGEDGVLGAARELTRSDDQGIDFSKFPLAELVRYSSFDGLEVPAFVFLPAGAKKGSPIPFVVNYHGGPEGQSRPGFSSTIQYLLSQGIGVMQPNVRGSDGYGRAFLMMDDYKGRWDSVRDGVAAAKWLVDQGYAQAGRIATYGGSYGGFMSVACVVEDQLAVDRGERKERLFGAGIDVVGIVNLKTFLEQTSGYRRKLREVEYGPLSDPEFLESVSSIHKIDKINVPMMIAHGLNDPRVPVGEAMQLAVGLRRRGLEPVELYFPDEGHGFAKLDNRELYMREVAKFLFRTIVDGHEGRGRSR